MEPPVLSYRAGRGLVLRHRDKYAAVRIVPSQFQRIIERTVKMMAEALWQDSWDDEERKEFVEAAVSQIGRLEERQCEGRLSSKDEPTDLQSLQSGL